MVPAAEGDLKRRLILAPHPDDEVLGCGGLLAKYPDECAVIVVSWPGIERWNEHRVAMEVLGVETSGHLSRLDGRVGDDPMALTSEIDYQLRRFRPEFLYLPYPGSHQDHVAVYEAGMRAARQSLSPVHWMPPNVLIYETPVYDLDTHDWPLRFSVFESLTADHVAMKQGAMEAYDSQVRKPHAGSPDELVARARSLGLARNLEYAEQFAPVRMVMQ